MPPQPPRLAAPSADAHHEAPRPAPETRIAAWLRAPLFKKLIARLVQCAEQGLALAFGVGVLWCLRELGHAADASLSEAMAWLFSLFSS